MVGLHFEFIKLKNSMLKQDKISYLILLMILLLALGLRIYKLNQVPPGLNRDEAAIGYNAYSLFKTGTDEYGNKWPYSFKSFGDWKLPVYFYLLIPFIATLGLSETVTRLPSGIVGTFTVLLTFIVVKELFVHKRKHIVALLAAFILAITPWHVFMSRNASESNIAVFITLLGITLFLISFRRNWLILLSFFFLALSLFTYHGNHVFTPLFIIGLCLFYYKELKKNKWFIPACLLFFILALFIYSQTLFSADKTKISGLFPLGDESLVYNEVVMRRLEYDNNSKIAKLLHNRPVYLLRTVINNYFKGFSSEFLFISGGGNAQHNIPGFGNLYIWEAVMMPFGLFFIFREKQKHSKLILYWLLITPIAASITKDAPHSARMMPLLPLPAIFSAYGVVYLILLLNSYIKRLAATVLISGIIILYLFFYLDQYFVHFPRVSAHEWGYGYKELVSKVMAKKSLYDQVVISKPENSPYIYFLFFEKWDPIKFQKEVVRYPQTNEGFQHVKQLGNLTFQKIGWAEELLIPNRLYVDWAENVPSGATNSAVLISKKDVLKLKSIGIDTDEKSIGKFITSKLIDKILLPDKTPLFFIIETKEGTPSAYLQ